MMTASVAGPLRLKVFYSSMVRPLSRGFDGGCQATPATTGKQIHEQLETVISWNLVYNLRGSRISEISGNKTSRVSYNRAANLHSGGLSVSNRVFPASRCERLLVSPERQLFVGSSARATSTSASKEAESVQKTQQEREQEDLESSESWTIKMLYDGDCPLCMREVNMLRERNKKFRTIKFVDISSDSYSAEENSGVDFETAMGRIHAILRDGTILTNVSAFKRLYEEVDLGWVYAITNKEPMAPGKLCISDLANIGCALLEYEQFSSFADTLYSFWAKYRLPLTGRPPLIEVLEARRQKQSQKADSCDVRGCRSD